MAAAVHAVEKMAHLEGINMSDPEMFRRKFGEIFCVVEVIICSVDGVSLCG